MEVSCCDGDGWFLSIIIYSDYLKAFDTSDL